MKRLPVCPTYDFLQSGHVNLYTPNNDNFSDIWFLCIRRLCMVLSVRYAILRSVLMNRLVMYVVSFLT